MKFRLFLALTIIAALISALIPAGETNAYFQYAGKTGSDTVVYSYAGNLSAQTFTTQNYSVPLEYANVKLYKTGSPGNVSMYIMETDTGGAPTGSVLTSSTVDCDAITDGTMVSFYFSPKYVLDKNTKYAIVIIDSGGSPSNNIGWGVDSTDGYSGGDFATSTDGGGTWSVNTSADAAFQVEGDPITISIMSVSVFQNIFESNDVLFFVSYNLNYGIIPHESAGDLFSVSIPGAANRSLDSFSYGVTSLYFSSASAPAWGSSQTITINGTQQCFGVGGATAYYYVTGSDYVSSTSVEDGRQKLYNALMNSAVLMGGYYNTTYTYSSYVYGQLLNSQGCVLYETAIPGIGTIFPTIGYLLSQMSGVSFEYTFNENASVNATQNSLMGALGVKTNAAFSGVGSYLAIPGGFLKMLFILFLYAIIASIVFLASGNSVAALILAIPVVGYGAYIGMFPLAILFTITFLTAMGMAYFIWLH